MNIHMFDDFDGSQHLHVWYDRLGCVAYYKADAIIWC